MKKMLTKRGHVLSRSNACWIHTRCLLFFNSNILIQNIVLNIMIGDEDRIIIVLNIMNEVQDRVVQLEENWTWEWKQGNSKHRNMGMKTFLQINTFKKVGNAVFILLLSKSSSMGWFSLIINLAMIDFCSGKFVKCIQKPLSNKQCSHGRSNQLNVFLSGFKGIYIRFALILPNEIWILII